MSHFTHFLFIFSRLHKHQGVLRAFTCREMGVCAREGIYPVPSPPPIPADLVVCSEVKSRLAEQLLRVQSTDAVVAMINLQNPKMPVGHAQERCFVDLRLDDVGVGF